MLKNKIHILFLFIVTLCTITFVSAEEQILKGKIIYIDPGHGGRDPGATYKELRESDINLQISKYLKEELENNGAKVYLTRIGDYDLSENNTRNHKKNDLTARARLINESNCDMYISIHLNSDPSPTWNGMQIFYTNNNKNNILIAQTIKEQLKLKRKEKELKNMYLFEKINQPGILIEVGFISNPNDRYKLKQVEYQQEISKNITNGIIEYFKKTCK
jgi:N-acetylmuramoyl-L-alanine amidase